MPRAANATPALATLLRPYSKNVHDTAFAARRILLAVLPGATEVVDSGARVIGYGYGTGYRDMICTLILSRDGVKLGVVGGAHLPDPRHLMEGKGKLHRHVPLAAPTDLRRPGLKPLVRAALSAWKRRANGGA